LIGFIPGLGLIDKLEAGAANGNTGGADFLLHRPKQKHIFFLLKLKKAAISGSLENFNKLID
jgi:hypothetical protein